MENYPFFTVEPQLLQLAEEARAQAAESFAQIEDNQRWNQQKMLAAFQQARVSESSFVSSTGYG